MGSFKDHFSTQAAGYRRFRPDYPPALFHFLAGQCPARALAWDCGCGCGQATAGLAAHFARVVGTDASASQIARARGGRQSGKTLFAVGAAERAPLPLGRVDLVTVAQALHWFDQEAFHAEVRRVLKPFGLLAAWTYDLLRIAPQVDRVIDALYHQTLAGFWPPERRHVDTRYADLAFPFEALSPPTFELEAQWDLARLVGFLGTWSATNRYRERKGADPVAATQPDLERAWGDPARVRRVRWPLTLLMGRVRRGGLPRGSAWTRAR
jgi:SAM-dependent methyltransferase